jgi:hypothetical protein
MLIFRKDTSPREAALKKTVPIMVIASVMLLASGATARERLGASVVLTMKDGRTLEGELYAVKTDEVVIVDA